MTSYRGGSTALLVLGEGIEVTETRGASVIAIPPTTVRTFPSLPR
jgi:hypothetical protein